MLSLFSDDEISKVEHFFGYSYKDDPERLAVIQCNKTTDIVACPGSGKTTCLAARLYLLCNRMPFKNNRGVCVLAHTNNTIDIIKKKLGSKAEIYSSYPNYLGTIQSFVDRFLAIPASIAYFGIRPVAIDNDIYYSEIDSQRRFLGRKVCAWCKSSGSLDFPNSIRYKWSKFNNREFELCNGIDEKEIDYERSTKMRNPPTSYEINKSFRRMKYFISKKGILCFDDAYSYAARYLYDNGEILVPIFSKRFKYIFIDEMQDTAKHQLEIIDNCFDDSVIIQRFGDPNQAIYNNVNALKASAEWDIRENPLYITSSMRFTPPVAKVVNKMRTEPLEGEIVGYERSDEISPIIILVNENNRKNVFKAFAKIINEKNLNKYEYPFKAIGWVGKKKDGDKLCIPKYCDFVQKQKREKKDFTCLKGYLAACKYVDSKKSGFKSYKDIIFRCLTKILKIAEVKIDGDFFSPTRLENYMSDNYKRELEKLRTNISKWCLLLFKGESIKVEIFDYICEEFLSIFIENEIEKLQNFLTKDYDEEAMKKETVKTNNRIKIDDIDIVVSTIHGAKGETHEATLYLETFFIKNDIEDIIPFLIGGGSPNKTQKKRLKMAYVGMSRSRSLLCVAADENSISGYEENLKKNGWKIRKIKSILS